MTREEEIEKKLKEIERERVLFEAEQELRNYKGNKTRGRSYTVGSAFGGTTELSIRGDGDDFLWVLLQPVEVTELIHQLAGNIGCHILIQPRKDFASWREWRPDEDKFMLLARNGGANEALGYDVKDYPLLNLFTRDHSLPEPEKQPGLNNKLETRKEDEPLAITKNSNKRKSKRPPAST